MVCFDSAAFVTIGDVSTHPVGPVTGDCFETESKKGVERMVSS